MAPTGLRRACISLLVLILLLLIASCSQPPAPPPITAVCNPIPVAPLSLPDIVESINYQGPEAWGPVHSLHVQGEMVYMGLGDSFAILDASNAADPRLVGSVPLNPQTHTALTNFSIRDGLAYFSRSGANFTIDVSDPAEPIQVRCGSAVPWPEAESAFAGRYFISNAFPGGIRIEERPLGLPEPVEVAAFTANTLPEIEWQQPSGQIIPLPALTDTEPMYVRSYTFDDRYLYLLNVLRIPGDYCCGRLTILDLENPTTPRQVSAIELPADLAPFSLKTAEDMLFINFYEPRGYNPSTVMYDISNKRRPEAISTIPGFALPQIHNDFAYFPGSDAIDIWELQGEDGPLLVGRIDIPGLTNTYAPQAEHRMAFVGDYIYYAAVSTLAVLNNEDPANPYLVKQLPYPVPLNTAALDVSDGHLAAVIRAIPNPEIQTLELDSEGGLGDWQPPTSFAAASFDDILLAGDWVYALDVNSRVGGDTTYLHGSDLSGTTSPTVTLALDNFDIRNMAAAYPYIYLVESTLEVANLLVVDASDPANPVLVWEMPLAFAYYHDLAVWEDNLYLASTGGISGIWLFDISNRERPQLIQPQLMRPQFIERPLSDSLPTITVGDGFLFGVSGLTELTIYDLQRPSGPALVGRYDLNLGHIEDMAYYNGVLYLALGIRGVAAVRLDLEDD